jgi:outer membrane lipase/esterase
LTNVIAAVCDPTKAATLPECTTQTLITDGSASAFLWADATHLSPAGHRVLGSLALSRATGNPF